MDAAKGAGSPDVLVVEDHRDGREALCMQLAYGGLAVESAADGAEGLRLGLERRPRVAVVDIGLPLVDGYEVARGLRRGLGRGVVLIAHTAYCTHEDRELARRAGFDFFLSKPAAPEELLRAVRSAA